MRDPIPQGYVSRTLVVVDRARLDQIWASQANPSEVKAELSGTTRPAQITKAGKQTPRDYPVGYQGDVERIKDEIAARTDLPPGVKSELFRDSLPTRRADAPVNNDYRG